MVTSEISRHRLEKAHNSILTSNFVSDDVIRFKHSRLSLGEIEILFNMLRDPFDVSEEAVDVEGGYAGLISIDLPIAYSMDFFKTFGMDRWESIKEVLKNMKWRRGKKELRLSLRFNGKPVVAFSLDTDDNKTFGKALETLEYQMDVILFQIDAERLPSEVSEVSYGFDKDGFRWYPTKATGDNAEYRFSNNEWIVQK